MSAGTAAKSMSSSIIFLSQLFLWSWRYAITPVIPKNGSQPATLAHLQFDSGVKVGRAGMSAGKKNASSISQ